MFCSEKGHISLWPFLFHPRLYTSFDLNLYYTKKQNKLIMNDYLVSEKGSRNVFAVLKDAETNEQIVEKTTLAVQEEYSYISVIPSAAVLKQGNTIFLSFHCEDEDQEEEVRDIELNLTAIY